jgi:putative two-component system response regulator
MYTILIVEDSPFHIDLLVSALEEKYNLLIAIDAEKALQILTSEQPDLIILDAILPGMNGYQFMEILIKDPQLAEIPVIFTTGMDQAEDQIRGFALGAVDYITKPFNTELVKRRVILHLELATHRKDLESLVSQRTKELVHTRDTVVQAVAYLAESRDQTTGDHIFKTQRYCSLLANELTIRYPKDLTPEEAQLLSQASALHDIGKVAIPDSILQKPGPLTFDEMVIMKTHTTLGAEAIQKTITMLGQNQFLQKAYEIAMTHHEKFDGSGYPNHIVGDDIPVSGRIVALVDVYDALTSKRPYKKAFTHERAMEIITEGDNRTMPEHFCPRVLQCFVDLQDQFKRILETNL